MIFAFGMAAKAEIIPAEQSVKKHVAAIHINNELSFLERKMSNALLWNAYEDLLKKDVHRIKVGDLAEIVGFDSNDRHTLKRAIKKLMQTVLEWNIIDERGREKEWEACSMLEYTKIKGAYCYYSYSSPLRRKFYNPEMYERINLSIQRKLSSGYALALYENCLRYRRVGNTGWIDLKVFRKLMGVSPNEYSDFRRLNARVIKGPVQQVNESSGIILIPEYKREKRRVMAIRFKVEENPQISLFREKNAKGEPERLAEPSELRKKLALFGLSEEQVRKILGAHEAEYIEEILKIVERDFQAGKVENLPAYTLAAIKNDFRPKASSYKADLTQQKQSRKKAEAERLRRQEEQEAQQREQEVRNLQQALSSLSASQRSALETRFRKQYGADPVYQKWQDQGIEHPVVQSLFRAFAKHELGAAQKTA